MSEQTIWLPNSAVRERAEVPATNARDLPPLNFLTPVYTGRMEGNDRQQYGLSERDFQRVMDGYACPECLLKFERRTDVCPLCSHERDIERDVVEAPRHWLPETESTE